MALLLLITAAVSLLSTMVACRSETVNLMHVVDRLNISLPGSENSAFQSITLRPFYYIQNVRYKNGLYIVGIVFE